MLNMKISFKYNVMWFYIESCRGAILISFNLS